MGLYTITDAIGNHPGQAFLVVIFIVVAYSALRISRGWIPSKIEAAILALLFLIVLTNAW
jgi:hypothetical protein